MHQLNKDKLIMNRREREQLVSFTKLLAGEINQDETAKRLNLTTRWVRKKFKRFLQEGDLGISHKNRGKVSHRRVKTEDRTLIVELLKTTWRGFGPKFTSEKLKEIYQIRLSREKVRQIMNEEHLWESKERKPKHRRRRPRKVLLGIMLQLDGSSHDWFEGRVSKCTLLVFIDDATSRLMWLEFVKSESLHGVGTATQHYFEKHGLPLSFYVDHGSVFSVNSATEHENLSQFERAMKELDIEMIHARSPQAKGRVERANRTLQDRLVKEMRLAGISSIAEANAWLKAGKFIEKHNESFAVPAAEEGDVHRSSAGYDIANIICIKKARVLANDFTISYKRRIFQLEKEQIVVIKPKERVVVHEHFDESITIHAKQCKLNHTEIGVKKPSAVDYVKWQKKKFETEGSV